MDEHRITAGVFDLTGGTSIGEFKELLSCLKSHYIDIGRDPAMIRKDILDRAAARNSLQSSSFGDLLRSHVFRMAVLVGDAALGVANDSDPDRVTIEDLERRTLPAHIDDACLARDKLTDKNFPRVIWPPFKIVTRVRAWNRCDLESAIRRGPPYH